MQEGLEQEFLVQLDALLQHHHDRLLARLLKRQTSNVSVLAPSKWNRRTKVAASSESDGTFEVSLQNSKINSNSKSAAMPELTPPVDYSGSEFDGEGALEGALEGASSAVSSFSAAEQLRRQSALSTVGMGHTSNVRQSMHRRLHQNTTRRLSELAAKVIATNVFEMFMSMVIMTNALFCGVEVEYSAQAKVLDPPEEFKWLAVFYSAVFTAEILLRLFAEGVEFFYKGNWRWNYFDTFIVTISLLEVVLDVGGTTSRQVPSIRVIRMARVVRVLRIARIMRHFRSLRILIYSVFNTLRSLLWTMMLLFLILFVFGILFTQATTQHLLLPNPRHIEGLQEAYGTVGSSTFTLFKAISGGVSWQEIVKPLWELSGIWVGFYLAYFAFVYFAVLNVVTGVFCQTAIESANKDHDMVAQAQISARKQYTEQLKQLFRRMDIDNSEKITLEEFEESLKDEKLQAYFASIEISVDEAFSLFKLLDQDGNHMIDIDTFVMGCLKLRGQAKCIDIALMMHETRWILQKNSQAIKSLEERICRGLPLFCADHRCRPATGADDADDADAHDSEKRQEDECSHIDSSQRYSLRVQPADYPQPWWYTQPPHAASHQHSI